MIRELFGLEGVGGFGLNLGLEVGGFNLKVGLEGVGGFGCNFDRERCGAAVVGESLLPPNWKG